MFGFWRKAKQDVQELVNEVTDDLGHLLVRVAHSVATDRGYKEGEPQTQALLERQGSMVQGFEAIRTGYHPKEIAEPRSKAAAEIAKTAVNTAILTGKLDMEKLADDLRDILDRSYSEYEVQEAQSISRLTSGPFKFGS
jgi:hypothetical protein